MVKFIIFVSINYITTMAQRATEVKIKFYWLE